MDKQEQLPEKTFPVKKPFAEQGRENRTSRKCFCSIFLPFKIKLFILIEPATATCLFTVTCLTESSSAFQKSP